jgi:hypothetical protein
MIYIVEETFYISFNRPVCPTPFLQLAHSRQATPIRSEAVTEMR